MTLFGIGPARMVSLRFETLAVVMGGFVLIGLGIRGVREARHGEKEVQDVSFGSWESSLLPVSRFPQMNCRRISVGRASRLPIGVTLAVIAVESCSHHGGRSHVRKSGAPACCLVVSRYAGIAAGVLFAIVGVCQIAEQFTRG